ncbi:hypothetical protein CYMTET_42218 [Cymbomonas tetramitiformis]|uniref:Uncharacterized protein n=1 Tax=Cymbomonas tetramitiformis TaxID=36881 RepID=A0AAE0C5U9_9CHLO|nr:hypothetical protein CYMTET_42218 [Cymbomonas tetramitiformis]
MPGRPRGVRAGHAWEAKGLSEVPCGEESCVSVWASCLGGMWLSIEPALAEDMLHRSAPRASGFMFDASLLNTTGSTSSTTALITPRFFSTMPSSSCAHPSPTGARPGCQ